MDFEMWIRALKAARASAGTSQEKLAEQVNYSASTIAAIETGRRRPTTQFAAAADEALATAGLLTELLGIANRQNSPSWFAPWRAVERDAVRLRTFQPSLVPGLLQTEMYARVVLTDGGLRTAEEVERLVETRMERQELLSGDDPTPFTAIVDEAALIRVVGDIEIQRAQLNHLLGLLDRPHIRLHAIPADAGAHPGLAGGFVLATLSGGDDVAYVDGVFGQVMDRPDAVAILNRMWDVLLGDALPERASRELIEKAVNRL